MTPFEKYCYNLYPEMLQGLMQTPIQSSLAFGFEVGPGWHPLLLSLFASLPPETRILQVKEKFGGLRVYADTTKKGQALLEQAETESYSTCEHCGATENVSTEGRWLKTLCKACREQ